MNVIIPIAITSSMVMSGTTIPALDTSQGETLWVSGGTYAIDNLRVYADNIYSCVQAHTGRTTTPDLDTAYWLLKQPTNRMAPFDIYVSTGAKATTSLTYVLKPGYFNALAMYGLVGSQYTITLKETTGGATLLTKSGYLYEDPAGWYEYLFSAPKQLTKLLFTNLPIRPDAELTVNITNAAGSPVSVGMINCGDFRPLIGDAEWGGTEWGAKAEPVTYSYMKTADDGTTKIVRRNKSTNLRVTVTMPQSAADSALAMFQSILDVPVSWIASDQPGYQGLNTFGIGSGDQTYETFGIAKFSINVKGFI